MFYIKEYFAYFRQQSYESLFCDECIKALENIEDKYAGMLSPKVIYEIRLDSSQKTTDFSMQMLIENSIIKDCWLEFDYDEYKLKNKMTPCIFYDASSFLYDSEWWDKYSEYIAQFIGFNRVVSLKHQLLKTVMMLDGLCPSLFQIGTMNSRNENESIRIYTKDMTRLNIEKYLHMLNWEGDYLLLDKWMQMFENIGVRQGFSVSFDIFPHGISKKIGIEFIVKSTRQTYREDVNDIVEVFIENNLCLKEKADSILKWIETEPIKMGQKFIRNMITHFKFQIDNDRIIAAKCYLGQTEK